MLFRFPYTANHAAAFSPNHRRCECKEDKMKRTALNSLQRALGATFANPVGWEMAASFGDPLAEHNAVRNGCGMTDFSSMGPIDVKGPDVARYLNYLTVNEVADIPTGRVVYTTMLNERGRILDDVTVYKRADDHYMVVTSTAKHEATLAWMKRQADGFRVYLTDLVSAITLICLQGPDSRDVLQKHTGYDLSRLSYFYFAEDVVAGAPTLISRTGFTGELGYELYVPSIMATDVWEALLATDDGKKVVPVGTGACGATLRLEKAYMGGAELKDANPVELPIAWTVKLSKSSFIGREATEELKRNGLSRKLVGLEVIGGVPAVGAKIMLDGEAVGEITSAGYGPTVGKNIALGFVPFANSGPGSTFEAEGSDGKSLKMVVVTTPFYDPKGKRVRS